MANKAPSIRFKGFEDAWKQRKLGELCERVQGNDGRMDLPTLTISAANGWMSQEDRFSGIIAGKEQKNYTLLHKGELSYNHGNSKLAKYGTVFSLETYEEALVPRVYHSFRMKNGDASFIEYCFATKIPDKELGKLISSGARMDGLLNIGYEEFMGIKMMIPSIPEQEKITSYLRSVDNLITLHQRKLHNLQDIKKSMLQKMFPREGKRFPELRFAGFTDPWEQRKLGSTKTFFTDGNYGESYPKASDMTDSSIGVPFLTGGNLKEGRLDITGASYITKEKHELLTSGHLIEDDIVIAVRGSLGALGYVNKENEDWNINSQLAILRTDKTEIYGKYLLQFLLSGTGQKELIRRQTGTALKQLPIGAIKDVEIPITSIEEQKKIGDCLFDIDNLITLHQRKLEQLINMKKSLLQKMFV